MNARAQYLGYTDHNHWPTRQPKTAPRAPSNSKVCNDVSHLRLFVVYICWVLSNSVRDLVEITSLKIQLYKIK